VPRKATALEVLQSPEACAKTLLALMWILDSDRPRAVHYALAHVVLKTGKTDATTQDKNTLASALHKHASALHGALARYPDPSRTIADMVQQRNGILSIDRRFEAYLSTIGSSEEAADISKATGARFISDSEKRAQDHRSQVEIDGAEDAAWMWRGWLDTTIGDHWSYALVNWGWVVWAETTERLKHNFPSHPIERARDLVIHTNKQTDITFDADEMTVTFRDENTVTVRKKGGVSMDILRGSQGVDWPPSRPNGRRFMYAVARKINTEHESGWPRDVDTRFEFDKPGENDWPAVARWAGLKGTRAEAVDVRACCVAMLAPVWPQPNGRRGNVCTKLHEPDGVHTGQKQAITLAFDSGFANLLDAHGKVVPIPDYDPPLLGYKPTHGPTFGIQASLFIKLREHAAELASKGCVLITESEWREWLEMEGFPKRHIADPRLLIDHWLAGPDAMIVEPRPWCFSLAVPRWERNLSQLMEAGQRSIKRSEGGKASAAARQAGAKPKRPVRKKP
jgi:hypothetical protein